MAIARVQTLFQIGGSINAVASFTFLTNVVAGDMILVAVEFADTTYTVVSITDNLGNTYSQQGPYVTNSNGIKMGCWAAPNIVGGSCTVTITLNQARGAWNYYGLEYQNVKTSSFLDDTSTMTGSGTSMGTGTITVTGTADLVLALFGTLTFSCNDFSSPFTTITAGGNGTIQMRVGEYIGASTDQSPTATLPLSAQWAAYGLSLIAASPPPPPPPPVNIYPRKEEGPVYGDPAWWATLPPPPGNTEAVPPKVVPPVPPIPPVPPPPPGVPPTVPPDPPAPSVYGPTTVYDPNIDARIRRTIQTLTEVHNSLVRRGILVWVQSQSNHWSLMAPTYGGITGTYP